MLPRLNVGRRIDTLVDLVVERATASPDRTGFIFLEDGESVETAITYRELDRRARRIAAALVARGGRDERALLLYPPGIDYICGYFGALYAGWWPVPTYPPDPTRLGRTLPRVKAILEESAPGAILTTAVLAGLAQPMLEETTSAGTPMIATDALADGSEDAYTRPKIDPETIALVQYTSGSLAAPKGVLVSHANLLHNLGLLQMVEGSDAGASGCSWLPPYHDMGLIGGILNPLHVGFPVVLMSPLHFLMRPVRWLRAMTKYRVTGSVGPNFAYALCARKVRDDQKEGLDLSPLEVLFNGAEPIRPEAMDAFCEAFASVGFRRRAFLPCFGLAETTLIATGIHRDDEPRVGRFSKRSLAEGIARPPASADDEMAMVSSGHPLAGGEVLVVDPERRRLLDDGRVGEIWLRSASVAKGYYARPEDTREAFAATLPGRDGHYLRTGDVGFMDGGHLYVTARLKDLIIVHGRNVYPPEIEATAELSHGAIRRGCVAAFSVDDGEQEHVVLVVEADRRRGGDRRSASSAESSEAGKRSGIDRRQLVPEAIEGAPEPRPFDPEEVISAVCEHVARAHDVRVAAVVLAKPGSVFKTPTGKIQRRACRDAFLDGRFDVIAERQFVKLR